MNVLDVLTAPWAIEPAKLEEITGIYSTHLRGDKIDLAVLEAANGGPFNNQQERFYEVIDGTAVIPVRGVLAKRMNLFSRISGGASTQMIQQDFEQALTDPEVDAIVIHLDTPGGAVDGTAELAQAIFNGRGGKPIVALVDGLMASAGVWIGTAADLVLLTGPTDIVGSIGVVTQHIDTSVRQEKQGIKVTEIFSGKFKRIASENAPLTDEGRAVIQDQLDTIYSIFVEAVATQRGATVEDVLTNMADGRVFIGQQAIDAGLVDGVSTLPRLIQALAVSALPDLLPTLAQVNTKGDQPATLDSPAVVADHADASGVDVESETEGDSEMNLTELREEHPELYAEAVAVGHADGSVAGADGERARIVAVLDQSIAGHEDLVKTLAFDGETTGPEAAVKVLNAERDAQGKAATDRAADAADLDDVDASLETDTGADTGLTGDEKVEADWEADEKLRAEFGDDFERYTAFIANEKRVKILGSK